MSCGVGHRWGLGPALLWLWYKPAATAPIWPLVWEFPYAVGAALKIQKKKKNQMEVLEMKKTVRDINNVFDEINPAKEFEGEQKFSKLKQREKKQWNPPPKPRIEHLKAWYQIV